MFDWKDYLILKNYKVHFEDKTPGRIDVDLDFIENEEKIQHDINELKQSLMNISKLFNKKLIFVVDKDKIKMFE